MPLWVVENKTNGHRTFSNFNEGLGKVLRFGANNDEVLNRLAWMRDELTPAMKAAIAQHGELELKPLGCRRCIWGMKFITAMLPLPVC